MFVTIIVGFIGAFSQSDATIRLIMICCCSGLVVSLALFLISINQDYVRTFFDTRTTSQYVQDLFVKETRDEIKVQIFTYSEYKWRAGIGGDVKGWLNERVAVWLEEDPKWFNEYVQSTIPDWVVDNKWHLSRIRQDEI